MQIRHMTWMVLIFATLVSMTASSAVSASPVSEIPEALNDGLFGGANLFAAQTILTAAILVSVGLFMTMLGLNYIATFIILFGVLGALTAMGWADITLMLIAGMLVAGSFVSQIVTYLTGTKKAG